MRIILPSFCSFGGIVSIFSLTREPHLRQATCQTRWNMLGFQLNNQKGLPCPKAGRPEFTGAGNEIRTRDPRLGNPRKQLSAFGPFAAKILYISAFCSYSVVSTMPKNTELYRAFSTRCSHVAPVFHFHS